MTAGSAAGVSRERLLSGVASGSTKPPWPAIAASRRITVELKVKNGTR
jgi:hypothetical protein